MTSVVCLLRWARGLGSLHFVSHQTTHHMQTIVTKCSHQDSSRNAVTHRAELDTLPRNKVSKNEDVKEIMCLVVDEVLVGENWQVGDKIGG